MQCLAKTGKAGLVMIVISFSAVLMLQSQGGSQRVDNFLNSLSRYANADMARSAFQDLRFTESERRLLEGGLRQPSYAPQVERLIKTIKGPAPKPQPPVKAVSVLNEEQARRIAGINQQLSTETQTLMAVSAKVLSSAALKAIVGTAPKITSLSQQTIEPGQALIIRGTDFLPQGSVSFTVGSSSFDAQVSEWTNDLIFAQFPAGVRGVAEMDGNVTVRKQNRILRADAPIHFVPIWEYQVLRSNALTYATQPWNLAAALALFFFTGQTEWCAQFNIYFPGLPSYNLLNTWAIHSLYYDSEDLLGIQREGGVGFIGTTRLPSRTEGQMCHHINQAATIFCVVTIKGPLGVPYK